MPNEYLYGRRAVVEALKAGRRNIRRLILAQGAEKNEPFTAAINLAKERGLWVEAVRREQIDGWTRNSNHQGIALEVGAYRYVEVEDILAVAAERAEPPFVLLLDLLQDVQNVGTLLRTAEAVGVHGVVIQERRSAEVTPAVVNASSGAVEHLRVAQVTNLVKVMEKLKAADVWLAGLDLGDDATRFDKANLRGGLGLVVGSEGAGLRRLVRETCDFIISLPMRGSVASLNAATAGSVALYKAWEARGFIQSEGSHSD
jgi:23S rRNA (guanosine2251-2'-O)-methyltransferase